MSKPAQKQAPVEAKADIRGPGMACANLRVGKGYNLDLPEMRGFATGTDVLAASDEVSIVFYPRLQQYIVTTPKRPKGVLVDTADCSADLG
jgi:hypothetical protein